MCSFINTFLTLMNFSAAIEKCSMNLLVLAAILLLQNAENIGTWGTIIRFALIISEQTLNAWPNYVITNIYFNSIFYLVYFKNTFAGATKQEIMLGFSLKGQLAIGLFFILTGNTNDLKNKLISSYSISINRSSEPLSKSKISS